MSKSTQRGARPPGGRQAEAARNDPKILAAARTVFVRDPEASVHVVAREAGVGVGAVYRRYAGKEELLQTLCRDGLRTFVEIARDAAGRADPGEAFEALVTGVVEADVHSLTVSLAGTFVPTPDMWELATEARTLQERVLAAAQSAGAVRHDVTQADLTMLLEQVTAVRVPDAGRTAALRRRYLALHLQAWRAVGAPALPGSPPTSDELGARWAPRNT
jgi:AcrR family transcriptional regulator